MKNSFHASGAAEAPRAIPARLNWALSVFFIGCGLWLFYLLPLLALPASRWWALTLLPLALLSNTFWYLIHEAFHFNLAKGGANEILGRTLCVFFGAPFAVVRFGHLMHHRFNRCPLDRPEVYDSARSSWLAAAPRYYFKLLGGLWLAEFLSPLLFFRKREGVERALARLIAPGPWSEDGSVKAIREAAIKQLASGPALAAVRLDGALIYLVFGTAFLVWGADWPLLALSLAARAFLVSLADNLPHYGAPLDQPQYAMRPRLPRPLQAMLMHFTLHQDHHRSPTTPWVRLPALFAASGEGYDAEWLVLALRQLRGPVPTTSLAAGERRKGAAPNE